jgi:cyclohexadienyl dehydratase
MQKRNRTAVWAACLLAAVATGCGECGNDDEAGADASLHAVIEAGRAKVGYLEWEPAVFVDPQTGKLAGVFVDMVEDMAATLNIQVEWVKTDLDHFTNQLSEGAFDFCVGPTFMTPQLATQVAFTQAVAYIGNAGVVRQDSIFAPLTIQNLTKAGLRIAVLRGQAMEAYARKHFPQAKLIVIPGDNLAAPLAAVSAGEADIGLSDTVTVLKYLSEDSNVKPVLVGEAQQMDVLPIAWSTRPEDARLREFLNSTIDYYKSTGRLIELQEKYPIHLLYDTPALRAK